MNSTKTTEQINPKSMNIHKKKISDILKIFNSEDLVVIKSIQKILPELEKLIDAVIFCFQNNLINHQNMPNHQKYTIIHKVMSTFAKFCVAQT